MISKRIFERLISFSMIEWIEDELEDSNHGTWRVSFPSIAPVFKSFIDSQLSSSNYEHSKICTSNNSGTNEFVFYRLNQMWIYLMQHKRSHKRFTQVLLAADFYPHTYSKILAALAMSYSKEPNLKHLMHEYLNLVIYDQVQIEEIALDLTMLEPSDVLGIINYQQIRSAIELFHLDIILIYTALLLKRRIAVYHHSPKALLDFVQSLPTFVPHREDCLHSMLVSNVDLNSIIQIDYLKSLDHYIATFVDPKIEKREELYDIYINLAAVEITISHNSRSVFTMTKTHKDVAVSLVRVVENSSPAKNQDIASEISRKTYELLNTLYSFVGSNVSPNSSPQTNTVIRKLSKTQLKEKLPSSTLFDFYWNLAIAEGIASSEEENSSANFT